MTMTLTTLTLTLLVVLDVAEYRVNWPCGALNVNATTSGNSFFTAPTGSTA